MIRRDFVRLGMSASAGALFVPSALAQNKDYYGGFKVGLQSYSLRRVATIEQQLDLIKELGIQYVETYNIPSDAPKERVVELLKLMKERHITPMAMGVVRMTKNEEATHAHFDFAQKMGLYSISADPDPDSFDLVGKLAEEHDINVAIHPHGPGHRYPGWKAVAAAIEGKSKRIGICMDTGHVSRAGDDPVEGVKVLKDRVYGAHLKDLLDNGTDVVVGQGKLDVPGFFKALRAVKFQGIISVEDEVKGELPANLVNIRASLEHLKKVLPTL